MFLFVFLLQVLTIMGILYQCCCARKLANFRSQNGGHKSTLSFCVQMLIWGAKLEFSNKNLMSRLRTFELCCISMFYISDFLFSIGL